MALSNLLALLSTSYSSFLGAQLAQARDSAPVTDGTGRVHPFQPRHPPGGQETALPRRVAGVAHGASATDSFGWASPSTLCVDSAHPLLPQGVWVGLWSQRGPLDPKTE